MPSLRTAAGRTCAVALALTFAPALAAPGAAQQPAATPERPPPLEVGAVAPDFALPAATRYGVLAEPVRLSDFAGKTVVLAFFPRARTSGCTIQMHAYRDQYADLLRSGQDVVLIAISTDTVEDLQSWAEDDQFQFLMASDKELDAARKYGAVHPRGPVTSRNLFVVGPDGRIAYTATPFREIDPVAYEELGAALEKILGQE